MIWAIVEEGVVVRLLANPKPVVIAGIRHPAGVFRWWSAAELAAVGVHRIVRAAKFDKATLRVSTTAYVFDGTDVIETHNLVAIPADELARRVEDREYRKAVRRLARREAKSASDLFRVIDVLLAANVFVLADLPSGIRNNIQNVKDWRSTIKAWEAARAAEELPSPPVVPVQAQARTRRRNN